MKWAGRWWRPRQRPTWKRTQVKANVGGLEVVTIRHDSEAQMETVKKSKTAPGGEQLAWVGTRRREGLHSRDRRGPPPEVMERYNKLSRQGQGKAAQSLHRKPGTHHEHESRGAEESYVEKTFKKVAEEDESSRK